MAAKQMIILISAIIAVAFLPAMIHAADIWVGDDKGWSLAFDYAAWADTKQFKVGDTLVFKYNQPNHTVVEVGGADFKNCTKPDNAVVWNTGEDRIPLSQPGRRWFFCGVGQHCQKNMKLKITVITDVTGAPSPSPVAPAKPPASSPSVKVEPRAAHAMAVVIAVIAAVLVF